VCEECYCVTSASVWADRAGTVEPTKTRCFCFGSGSSAGATREMKRCQSEAAESIGAQGVYSFSQHPITLSSPSFARTLPMSVLPPHAHTHRTESAPASDLNTPLPRLSCRSTTPLTLCPRQSYGSHTLSPHARRVSACL
jgi:hypothetical protein